jgi:hypothetical protein
MPLEVFLHCLLRGMRFDAKKAKADMEFWTWPG